MRRGEEEKSGHEEERWRSLDGRELETPGRTDVGRAMEKPWRDIKERKQGRQRENLREHEHLPKVYPDGIPGSWRSHVQTRHHRRLYFPLFPHFATVSSYMFQAYRLNVNHRGHNYVKKDDNEAMWSREPKEILKRLLLGAQQCSISYNNHTFEKIE